MYLVVNLDLMVKVKIDTGTSKGTGAMMSMNIRTVITIQIKETSKYK
jgi:hypothetical protein